MAAASHKVSDAHVELAVKGLEQIKARIKSELTGLGADVRASITLNRAQAITEIRKLDGAQIRAELQLDQAQARAELLALNDLVISVGLRLQDGDLVRVRSTVEETLGLPILINLTLDPLDIALARAEMEAAFDDDFKINVDDSDLTNSLDRLTNMRPVTIPVRYSDPGTPGGRNGRTRVQVDVDDGYFSNSFRKAMLKAKEQLPKISPLSDDATRQQLAYIRAEMESLADARIGVDIDATEAKARLDELKVDLIRLGSQRAEPTLRLNAASAFAELTALQGQLFELDKTKTEHKVDVDTGAAFAKLAALNQISGESLLPEVGLDRYQRRIAAITAAVVALIPTTGALTNVLGGAGVAFTQLASSAAFIPGIIASVGTSFATLRLGFDGVFEAVGDQLKVMDEATTKSDDWAQQTALGFRAVRDAREALADANDRLPEAFEAARERIQAVREELRGIPDDLALIAGDIDIAYDKLDRLLADPTSDPIAIKEMRQEIRRLKDDEEDLGKRKKELLDEDAKNRRDGISGSDEVLSALDAQRDAVEQLRDAQFNLRNTMQDGTASQQAAQRSFDKLSDEAQQLVLAILAVRESYSGLKDDIQDETLANVAELVQRLGESYLPILRDGLLDVADATNQVILATGDYLNTAAAQEDVARIIRNTADATRNWTEALPGLTDVFLTLASVGSSLFPKMAEDFGGMINKFGDFLDQKQKSGELLEFFDTAYKAVKSLGDILFNLGSIFSSVFESMDQTDGGPLQAFARVTGQIADFLNDPKIEKAMGDFFTRLFEASVAITDGLGPTFEKFFPVFTDLFASFAEDGAEALNTILEAIMKLVIDGGPAFEDIFGSLFEIISQFLSAFLPALVPFFEALSKGLEDMEPLGKILGELFGELLISLIPLIQPLAEALIALLPAIVEVAISLAENLVPILIKFLDVIAENPDIVAGFIIGFTAFASVLSTLAPLLAGLGGLVSVISAIAGITISGAVVAAVVAVGAGIALIATVVTRNADKIKQFFKDNSDLIDDLKKSFDKVIQPVKEIFGMFVEFIEFIGPGIGFVFENIMVALDGGLQALGGVLEFFSGLMTTIKGIFTLDGDVVKNGFKKMFSGIGGILSGLFKAALAPVITIFRQFGVDFLEGLKNGFLNGLDNFKEKFKLGLQTIVDAFKDFFGIHSPSRVFAELGRFLIEGLINGIEKMLDKVIGLFKSLGTKAKDALDFAWEKIKDGLRALGDFFQRRWDNLINNFTAIGERLTEAGSTIWDGFKDGFKAVLDAIIELWNGIDFGINITVPDWVPKIGGKGFVVDDVFPDIPRLANGGITNGETIALIGDNMTGRERVTPLGADGMSSSERRLVELTRQNMEQQNVMIELLKIIAASNPQIVEALKQQGARGKGSTLDMLAAITDNGGLA